MKNKLIFPALLAAVFPLFFAAQACRSLSSADNGTLVVTLCDPLPLTRANAVGAIPDVEDFILLICDKDGEVRYEGRYGNSPESLSLPAGSYTVSARSCDFSRPEYDSPQYGDSQVVVVNAGSRVSARLSCTQMNSGLRLVVEDSFKEEFPNAELKLENEDGSLSHTYDEKRIAYFRPGDVAVSLSGSSGTQDLFNKELGAAQILSVRLSASPGTATDGIRVQLDTTRQWLEDKYHFGSSGGLDPENAYSVSDAKENIGQTGVWVCGYIVGVAMGTNNISFSPPFSKNTNIVIGMRPNTDSKEHCISVELKAGTIRDNLNLQDNPKLLGKKIYCKGNIVESYFGIVGLKGTSEYQFGN